MREWAFEGRVPESIAQALQDEPDPDQVLMTVRMLRNEPALALKRLEDLADRGSLLSMVFIGDTYLYGHGVERDVDRGKRWMLLAASGGSLEARFRLARFYNTQGETAKSIAELRGLSESGYAPAMFILGWRYYRGGGVENDVDQAIRYWTMAEDRGHLLARQILSHIYRTGRFGIVRRIHGYIKLISLIFPFARYMTFYPNSDRVRTWGPRYDKQCPGSSE